uniref:Peptidase A1 domain-containing protein n=1 Tax=Bursaphelenchus xylophilus TaxID=6326 RepID=A0A1I7RKE9_BURXY
MRSISISLLLVAAALAIEIPIRRVQRKESGFSSGIPIDLDTGSKAFVGTVSIGNPGQDINVAFDTSTSALWVPDASCSCAAQCGDEKLCPHLCASHCCAKKLSDEKSSGSCSNKNVFDPERSRSYVKGTGSSNLTFLGSTIQAALGHDTFRLGTHYRPGLTANNVQFGVVKEFNEAYQDVNYDGVFGLGLASKDGVPSPIKQLADHGVIPSPLLSLYLFPQTPDNVVDGVLTVGQLDRQRCLPVTRFVKVEKEEGWIFSATTFKIDASGYKAHNESWRGVFDFGSEYIHMPRAAFSALRSHFSARNDSEGRLVYPCRSSRDVLFNVGGELIYVSSTLLSAPYDGFNCQFKVKETDANDKYAFRYGLPVLQKNCVVFDFNGLLALPKKRE